MFPSYGWHSTAAPEFAVDRDVGESGHEGHETCHRQSNQPREATRRKENGL